MRLPYPTGAFPEIGRAQEAAFGNDTREGNEGDRIPHQHSAVGDGVEEEVRSPYLRTALLR